jgi:hypothetical protein
VFLQVVHPQASDVGPPAGSVTTRRDPARPRRDEDVSWLQNAENMAPRMA